MRSDARGAWTLPSLVHLPYGAVVLLIAIVAVLGFIGAEAIERRGETTTNGVAQTFRSAASQVRVAAVLFALLLAVVAAFVGTPVNAATSAAAQAKARALYKPPSGC